MKRLGLALALGLLLAGPVARLCGAPNLADAISGDYPYLEKLYQHLHAHPELSLQERETAARLARELEALGFTITTGVGGHGIVGLLRNGEGPTLLIRADMDALPVSEQTGLPFASTVHMVNERTGQEVPVAHACGHDVHMTVLVGTARRLAALTNRWRGTLMLIAQPGEEIGAGAKAMLGDGLFQRFPRPDFALALHVHATLEAGRVGYVPGFAFANVDSVDLAIHGVGGHGAFPHEAKDPIVLASQIVLALQTIASREIDPQDPIVVTVGSIHGGAKHNVISDRVDLQLTVRTYSDETRERVFASIRRIAEGTARAFGLPEDKLPEMTVQDEYTPSLYNDPALTERLARTLRATLGEEQVTAGKPTMAGEDFGR